MAVRAAVCFSEGTCTLRLAMQFGSFSTVMFMFGPGEWNGEKGIGCAKAGVENIGPDRDDNGSFAPLVIFTPGAAESGKRAGRVRLRDLAGEVRMRPFL